MGFPKPMIIEAFNRAGRKCECRRTSHTNHIGKFCERKLRQEDHGRGKPENWEAHHKDGNPDNNIPSNCEILCWPCHEKTLKNVN